MKKIIIALCVALAVFAVGYNAYQSEKQDINGKKKVHVILPLTGVYSRIGNEKQDILNIYIKKHPEFHMVASANTLFKC